MRIHVINQIIKICNQNERLVQFYYKYQWTQRYNVSKKQMKRSRRQHYSYLKLQCPSQIFRPKRKSMRTHARVEVVVLFCKTRDTQKIRCPQFFVFKKKERWDRTVELGQWPMIETRGRMWRVSHDVAKKVNVALLQWGSRYFSGEAVDHIWDTWLAVGWSGKHLIFFVWTVLRVVVVCPIHGGIPTMLH